jgi:hypothetical protein
VSCNPYTCGTGACRTTCTADADCVSPFVCIGTACVPNPNLKVQYQCADVNVSSQAIRPWLRVINNGSSAVPLSTLTIRYFYTLEGTAAETPVCDWAQLGCNNVTMALANNTPPRTNASRYFQIGFTSGAGNLAAGGGSTGNIQVWFHKNDWTTYTQNTDYSFDPTKPAFADWNRAVLYQNGTRIWGVEPP